MRTFEYLTCVLTLASSSLLLFAPAWRAASRALMLVLALSVAVQILREGAHWQLIPLYLACFILFVLVLSSSLLPRRLSFVAAASSLLLMTASAALSWLMPMFQLPQPTGPYAVGTCIVHLVDGSRREEAGPTPSGNRELMIQAWYPAQSPSARTLLDFFHDPRASYQRRGEVTLRASYRSVLKTNSYLDAPVRKDGPYPVILYNPGWMGERTEGTYQMEELASHGFIVVSIDHTFYGGLVEFPDGRVADSINAPELGSFEHSTLEQQADIGAKLVHIEAKDDIFVLAQLQSMNNDPAGFWFHQIDISRVGAMGFSIGGAVAEQAAFDDPRVQAALDLDGWSFGELQQHGLPKPLMVIFEDKQNTIPTPAQLSSGPESQLRFWQYSQQDFLHVTESLEKYGGFLLFVAGAEHVDFTDRTLFSPLRSWTGRGSLAPDRVHAIVNAYTLAFFSHYLRGSQEPLLQQGRSPFSEVDMKRFNSPSSQIAR